MNGWFLFAQIVFGVGLIFFTFLAIAVTIGGAKDIRAMFNALDKQHKEKTEE